MIQLNSTDIAQIVLRGIMDRFPNLITIGDYKLDHYYVTQVNGFECLGGTFQQATLGMAGWIKQHGLDHISISLWFVNEDGVPSKVQDLSSNETYYKSIYNYLLRNKIPFTSKGIVKFNGSEIIPVTMIEEYQTVFMDDILIQYFFDAPSWIRDGDIYTHRELQNIDEVGYSLHDGCMEQIPILTNVIKYSFN